MSLTLYKVEFEGHIPMYINKMIYINKLLPTIITHLYLLLLNLNSSQFILYIDMYTYMAHELM